MSITWRPDYHGGSALANVAYQSDPNSSMTVGQNQALNFANAPNGPKDNNGTNWQVLKAIVHVTNQGVIEVRIHSASTATNHDKIILDAVRLRRLDGRFNTPDQSVINVGNPLMKFVGDWIDRADGTQQSLPTGNTPSVMAIDLPQLDPGEYRVLVKWNATTNNLGDPLIPQSQQSPPFIVSDGPQPVGAKRFDQTQLANDLAGNWAILGVFPIASGTLHLEVRAVNFNQPGQTTPYSQAVISSVQIERVTDNTPITTYVWDHKNRLTEVVRRAADYNTVIETIDYTYDVAGRLVERASDFADTSRTDATDFYLFDGQQQVATLTGQLAVKEARIYGQAVDQVLAIEAPGMTDGNVFWPLLDFKGTIERIVNMYGGFDKDYDYDVFGRPFTTRPRPQDYDTRSMDEFYSFAGREFDFDTRLQNFGPRFYDPFTRQFASQDPRGPMADTNPYRFPGNNPTAMGSVTPAERFDWGQAWTDYQYFLNPLNNNGSTGERVFFGVTKTLAWATFALAAPWAGFLAAGGTLTAAVGVSLGAGTNAASTLTIMRRTAWPASSILACMTGPHTSKCKQTEWSGPSRPSPE